MLILITIGTFTFISIPKDAEPDIDVPFVYVSVVLPGISPEDSERLIVRPLETELKNIEGLKEISGMASQNYGSALLEFDISFDSAGDGSNPLIHLLPQPGANPSVNVTYFLPRKDRLVAATKDIRGRRNTYSH